MSRLVLNTDFGKLYSGDCVSVMNSEIIDESIDLIFADPPFNIGKNYKSKINDAKSKKEYLDWTRQWITVAAKALKPGGSIFVYNLPKWNIHTAQILEDLGLEFKHWIAIDQSYGLPIKGRLYPSHYSLLYFTKGKPNTFTPPRTPIEKCRHCAGDIKDYGGHRNKLNKNGLNLKDLWVDIGKRSGKTTKSRRANELPLKLVERVLSIASKEGDTVLDPFAGSGSMLAASELLRRRWIGIELDDCLDIIERLSDLKEDATEISKIRKNANRLE